MRLDQYVCRQGIFASRAKAQEAIRKGRVLVNGKPAHKCGQEVSSSDAITHLDDEKDRYVSRSAEKLMTAFSRFDLSPQGCVCLDIGASTGGFTQCLYERQAAYIYAVDVGHDQLHPSLRNIPNIEQRDGVNGRYLQPADFDRPIDLIVMDVSFISCRKMLDAIGRLLPSGKIAIFLIKPQFELPDLPRTAHGVIHPSQAQLMALFETIQQEAATAGLALQGICPSTIAGKEGNQEYLAYGIKDGTPRRLAAIYSR